MEDAHVVHLEDAGGYFGVLDGHGGTQCSIWCAARLHEFLQAHGLPRDDAAAKKMVLDIDQAYLDTGTPSGSTAAMCVVRPPAAAAGGKYRIHVINAGDSRVLLSRADGTIVDGGGTDAGLTIDHKPDNPDERERIYRCGGTVEVAMGGVHRVNGDLAVSRGFGDATYKQTGGPGLEDRPVTANPEMGHFECDASDFILVVCDGVSEGNFPNPEVCQLAARVLDETGGDAAAACKAVCAKAIDAESKDNISCMIILLGGATADTKICPGKQSEFHPGCLIGCNSQAYVDAYTAMCVRGGTTFPAAAEERYATVLGRRGTPAAEETDDEELAMFDRRTPAGAKGSAERRAWFEGWAQACTDDDGPGGGGGGGRGGMGLGGPGGGPGGLQSMMQGADPQEKAAMMQMFMSMMQQGGGPGGPGGRK
jgi:protein phosphatase